MNKKVSLKCFLSICLFILLLLAVIVKINVTSFSQNINENNQSEKFIYEIEKEKLYIEVEKIGKLNITNAYGNDSAYHPKLISFDISWNGYKYWLCFTPYPNGDDSKENPHIVVSNDMVNFKEVEGFKNPLEEKPKDYLRSDTYFSDPNLVYNSDTKELECWWRYSSNSKDKAMIYRKTTKDGINWSEKQIVLASKKSNRDYISPAVVYEDGTYKMWYVSNPYTIYYQESKDLINWTETQKIDVNYEHKDLRAWHLDVVHTKGIYKMVVSAFLKGKNRLTMNLYYAESLDNKKWTVAKKVLSPSKGKRWDNRGIYRSCLFEVDNQTYICYSASSKQKQEGIGIVKFNVKREKIL